MRDLTGNERAVLAHVVVDPDAWWAHATSFTRIDEEKALAAKVKRWQSSYDGEGNDPAYKTRAVRQAEEDQLQIEAAAVAKTTADAAKVAADADLQAKIDAAVEAALAAK